MLFVDLNLTLWYEPTTSPSLKFVGSRMICDLGFWWFLTAVFHGYNIVFWLSHTVASICFQHCEGPKSLRYLPPLLSSYSPSFPSSPFPLPLEVVPLIQLGSAVSSHSGVRSEILVHFEGEETLLVAFKMHGFKQLKTAFPYIFYENIFQALTIAFIL